MHYPHRSNALRWSVMKEGCRVICNLIQKKKAKLFVTRALHIR